MTALAGVEILTDEYNKKRIVISFNPLARGDESTFEVLSAAIKKDKRWLQDISEIFHPNFSSYTFVNKYKDLNPDCDAEEIGNKIQGLIDLKNRQLGVIDIKQNCNVDEVTDIFIRINSKGAVLSQADFAMSKIAADDEHGGSMLRKAIDYYCHLAVKPEFWSFIQEKDKEYMATDYARLAEWLKNDKEDIYDPDYTDVLRVSFMYGFKRGKLADLVALLSGRDFEKRDYKQEIADESFSKMTNCVKEFMKESNFKDFMLAIKSAGFTSSKIVYSQNALDFAYNLYLSLKQNDEVHHTDRHAYVQRWYVMSLLTGRYSASPESRMNTDMRNIDSMGFLNYYDEIKNSELSEDFWNERVPLMFRTTSKRSGVWLVYLAAMIKDATNTLFSNCVKYNDIVNTLGDVHHIFPRAYLQRERGLTRKDFNQLANFTHLETHINKAISDRSPKDYFNEAYNATENGTNYFGNIYDKDELLQNMKDNCIPESVFDMDSDDYEGFLIQRRKLMAKKIKGYFISL